MKTTLALLAPSALPILAGCQTDEPVAPDLDPVLAFSAADAEYEVTIENLTAAQPFTPPLIATHRAATHMFRVGEPASAGIQQIAENGNLEPMIATLESDRHVWEHVVALGSSTTTPAFRGSRTWIRRSMAGPIRWRG